MHWLEEVHEPADAPEFSPSHESPLVPVTEQEPASTYSVFHATFTLAFFAVSSGTTDSWILVSGGGSTVQLAYWYEPEPESTPSVQVRFCGAGQEEPYGTVLVVYAGTVVPCATGVPSGRVQLLQVAVHEGCV